MTKFNVIQKKRRAQTAERKRELFGHPLTGKLTEKPQFVPISGKRKRKLFKKWRRVCFLRLSLSLSLFLL